MLRIRRITEGLDVGSYAVTATDPKGHRTVRIFGNSRSDCEAYLRFIEDHRDLTNRKPFRSKALKEEARRKAYLHNGTWRSDVGTL